MVSVTCPSCGEKGNLPSQLLGKRIKCQKCGKSFLAGSSTAEAPAKAVVGSAGAEASPDHAIDIPGLDAWTWTSPAVAAAEPISGFHHHPHEPEPAHHDSPEASTASSVESPPAEGPHKEYKVLTQKDRWFEGKYELSRLEEALNHYARQGWIVRAMATPHVTGFSGGIREELVVLLER